ncbi:MAG TPA: hypothetical protein VFF06_17880 [Polyangia bacterium]|nr:hypothetical protein [Polyangia bacterium]
MRALDTGGLVISLDFELHWGVRDLEPAGGGYRANLLGARAAIPRLLELFARWDVAATWATVGMLFARDRDELRALYPDEKPGYADARLSPYGEPIGADERADPLHYAASLVERIRETPRQELASHTFSHYYCLEPGQTRAQFRADLDAAVRAAALRGVKLRSLVLPRNQLNPDYAGAILDAGFTCYRGNARGWMYRPGAFSTERPHKRLARLADAFVPLSGANVIAWERVREPSGLCNVAASRFLRPALRPRLLDERRLARVIAGVRRAAERRALYHLWWHPHNFGVDTDANLAGLEAVLREQRACRDRHGLRSLTMAEAAEAASG